MKIDIILLAAGDSRRFGKENKLNYFIAGIPMYEHAMNQAATLKQSLPDFVGKIIVVSKYEFIKEACKRRNLQGEPFVYVENRESKEGISASVRLGANAADVNNAMLFMVCDRPFLKVETWIHYLQGFLKSRKPYAGMMADGHFSGNCIFPFSDKEVLMGLTGDCGGKKIIQKAGEEVFWFPVNSREVRDVDQKEDL